MHDPFQSGSPDSRAGAPAAVSSEGSGRDTYVRMIEGLRRFLDLTAGAKPDAAVLLKITEQLEEASTHLESFQVPEHEQVFGHLNGIAGRGQTLTPPFVVTAQDRYALTGTVEFGRYFLGSGGAVNGGAIPLLFDEVLGGLAIAGGRPWCRTAYLHVDYRSITPVGVRLDITARFVREEGRKRFLSAELRHGDTLCAEIEGLFVELRPGQP